MPAYRQVGAQLGPLATVAPKYIACHKVTGSKCYEETNNGRLEKPANRAQRGRNVDIIAGPVRAGICPFLGLLLGFPLLMDQERLIGFLAWNHSSRVGWIHISLTCAFLRRWRCRSRCLRSRDRSFPLGPLRRADDGLPIIVGLVGL